MTTQPQLQFRHAVRPLSVFTFCGQPIAEARGEYLLATRDLPPCPDCQRARDSVVARRGAKRRLSSGWSF